MIIISSGLACPNVFPFYGNFSIISSNDHYTTFLIQCHVQLLPYPIPPDIITSIILHKSYTNLIIYISWLHIHLDFFWLHIFYIIWFSLLFPFLSIHNSLVLLLEDEVIYQVFQYTFFYTWICYMIMVFLTLLYVLQVGVQQIKPTCL